MLQRLAPRSGVLALCMLVVVLRHPKGEVKISHFCSGPKVLSASILHQTFKETAMNEHQSTDERQENGAESSQPYENAATGSERDSHNESQKGGEDALSFVTQIVDLMSSILAIVPPSMLTFAVALDNNVDGGLLVGIAAIFGTTLLAVLVSTILKGIRMNRRNKASNKMAKIPGKENLPALASYDNKQRDTCPEANKKTTFWKRLKNLFRKN